VNVEVEGSVAADPDVEGKDASMMEDRTLPDALPQQFDWMRSNSQTTPTV
jgi:hypothetical protein